MSRRCGISRSGSVTGPIDSTTTLTAVGVDDKTRVGRRRRSDASDAWRVGRLARRTLGASTTAGANVRRGRHSSPTYPAHLSLDGTDYQDMQSSSFARASLISWSVVSLLAFGCNFQQSASPSPTVVATGGMGGGSPIIVTGSFDGGAGGAGARDGGAPSVCPAQCPAGKVCLAGSCQPDPCVAGVGDDLRGRHDLPRELRPDRRPMRGRDLSPGADLRRRRLRRRLLRATLQRRDLPGRAVSAVRQTASASRSTRATRPAAPGWPATSPAWHRTRAPGSHCAANQVCAAARASRTCAPA